MIQPSERVFLLVVIHIVDCVGCEMLPSTWRLQKTPHCPNNNMFFRIYTLKDHFKRSWKKFNEVA